MSEILNLTYSALYERNDQLNNSGFEDSFTNVVEDSFIKDNTLNIRAQNTEMASGDSRTSTVIQQILTSLTLSLMQ